MTRYEDLEEYRPEPPRGPGDRRRKRLRRTIKWTAWILVIVLVVLGGYVGYNYWHFASGVKKVGGALPGGSNSDGVAQNILLIGNDERPANMTAEQYAELSTTPDGGGMNTDTMILLHVPANGGSATLVSFPRDSLVDIPGYGKNKLNAAYVFGRNNATGTDDQKEAAGVKLLVQTIQNLTGLTIDHYVKVTLLSFYNIANALGPVTVCLKNAVNDPYSGANFPAGVQQLNATQALQFVRQRHGLPNGDFDRAVRQQYFLSVEAQQILSAGTLLNPGKLNKVISAVSGALETDDKLNLASLAAQMSSLRGGKIKSATIPLADPSTGTADVGGQELSVDFIDYDALPDFIDHTVLGEPTDTEKVQKAKAADPSDVTVDVLNGAGTSHGSSTALATFAQLGFKTGQPTDADETQKTTTIYYPKGEESAAKAVLDHLPGASAAQSSKYDTVTVVLGTDGLMPSAGGQASAPSAQASQPSSSATPSSPTTNYTKTTCIN